ncbi:hypothetical protein QQS21_007628 [Conoideocrella luteorostrata]|uniref:Polyketide synthase n=1 Tax=Conoideocrella luteorostrata TaxID=1105319 RepID=A0AAJ0CN66_9HYPO|nr:hypothetical protein QQS21_007628 [Conoideocrella luteorostrata]
MDLYDVEQTVTPNLDGLSIATPSTTESLTEPGRMKLYYFGNEFPHDELEGLVRHLRNYSKDRQHRILDTFIHEATLALRDEVRLLPSTLRSLVPPFENIFTLVHHAELRGGRLGAAVDGMLLCAVQLATFIGYHENTEDDTFDFHNGDPCLAGLGTGLLSTAAVSIAPTLADLPIAGAEVIRIAFRLGILVNEVSYNLQPRTGDGAKHDSWAYVVPNVTSADVQAHLDATQAAEKTPTPSKIFISAVSRTSVTISGPPTRLKHMFQASDFFRDLTSIPLPVYGGLCHAKHIYNKEHTTRIVNTSTLNVLSARFTPRAPVLSPSTGQPFPARSPTSLFHNIVEEILTQVIRWDEVIQGVVGRARDAAASEVMVHLFRTSLPARDLFEAFKSEPHQFKGLTTDLIQWIYKPTNSPRRPRSAQQAKIAIVGMACRMPGGDNTDQFWDVLNEGLDMYQKIPSDRFDVESHCDPTGKRLNTSVTPYGCFIDEPGLFDAPFFNMSPREALQTDPMQRLAIVTAYEALERAGYVANRTAATDLHRIGTFYGQASDDYREVNSAQEISTYFITGGCRAFGPGRINYFFKFSGPSYSIDTACSSGLATIHVACNSLWSGDTDMAVAGGMNVLTNSDAFAGLSNGHFLSKTPGACKTWDCDADGYCRADGVATVILKRLEDAEADNDNILGVILASGTNHSAEAISITHPHAGHQAYLARQLLEQAGVDALDVSYVEMHGTGTQAGDAQEIQSVTEVFAPLTATKRRSPNQPLHIGAVKSSVGHGEAVAGTTALLKVLLMFEKEIIPPHVGIKNSINQGFPTDLEKRNLHIPYERTPWPHVSNKKRIAVVNNFSAAGGNTSLVIEEAPARVTDEDNEEAVDTRATHVFTVSAKSKLSLKGNLERLISFLDANTDVSLPNLAYTTTARRQHHNHRVAISASDVSHLKKSLNSYIQSVDTHKPIPATGAPPVVFVFTGQGASYRSMNLELFSNCPFFRSEILHLDLISQAQGFPTFIPVIDGRHPKDYSHSPVETQLALVCTEIALAKYWESLGVTPSVVIGHSLGEYAALHVAGVLSAADAIFLVGQRATLLERECQANSHKMLAVRASLDEITSKANSKKFDIACLNGPQDTVLSGTETEIENLAEELNAGGYKCFPLDVAFAFHSAQTDAILDELEETTRIGALFQPPQLPIVSPLLGKVIFDEKTVDAEYIRRATRETVNFKEAIETAYDMSIVDEAMVWIEIGPHPVGVGFVKSILPSVNVAVPSFRRGENNWHTLSTSLAAVHAAGVHVDWNEFHRPFERGLRLLDLPTYAWNNKTYWLQYNGDWALTKGNTFYDSEKKSNGIGNPLAAPLSSLRTSLVHLIVEETFSDTAARVVVQSDMMQSDFLAAAWGHKMNNAGVVTSSIHADIAWTLGKYAINKLRPKDKKTSADMEIRNLVVREGLVAQTNTNVPQLIQVSIEIQDVSSGVARLEWHNVRNDGYTLVEEEPVVTAEVIYASPNDWLPNWVPLQHFVLGRIAALKQLAERGQASRLSHDMAYLLFANKLVDYAEKYRGMQSVVMHDLEAFAEVTLKDGATGGVWTVPPYFMDSVFHLAGFVMNVSDAIDMKNFCVTPGWRSLRLARPLVAGGGYRSYVKMIPTPEDQTVYLGDVYVLQDDEIIGVMQAMKFRRYPRVLLNRFFTPAEVKNSASGDVVVPSSSITSRNMTAVKDLADAPAVAEEPESTEVLKESKPKSTPKPPPVKVEPAQQKDTQKPAVSDSESTATKAMQLVAKEAGLDLGDLDDDVNFANIGVDSLMSLVIAEKLREQLGVAVSGSLFLEYPTAGDLRAWLVEYYC